MKYIIVANGPFLPTEVIREAIHVARQESETQVVALDGETTKLKSYLI